MFRKKIRYLDVFREKYMSYLLWCVKGKVHKYTTRMVYGKRTWVHYPNVFMEKYTSILPGHVTGKVHKHTTFKCFEKWQEYTTFIFRGKYISTLPSFLEGSTYMSTLTECVSGKVHEYTTWMCFGKSWPGISDSGSPVQPRPLPRPVG